MTLQTQLLLATKSQALGIQLDLTVDNCTTESLVPCPHFQLDVSNTREIPFIFKIKTLRFCRSNEQPTCKSSGLTPKPKVETLIPNSLRFPKPLLKT